MDPILFYEFYQNISALTGTRSELDLILEGTFNEKVFRYRLLYVKKM